MIISAINGVNYSNKFANKKTISKPNQKNEKVSDKANSNYSKTAAKSPSFGLDPFLLGYLIFYASVVGSAVYKSNLDEKKRAEEQQALKAQRERDIAQLSQEFRVSVADAEKYHSNFLRLAQIKPTNDGHEKGLNAVQGYGIEKYKLAMNLVAPFVAKSRDTYLGYKAQVPNGVLLYGPTGGGKTYMADKVAEHLKYFGMQVETIELDSSDHSKNAKNIKEAFDKAEENYKQTGKMTLINFPQDIDNYFMDRRSHPECVKEVRTLLNCSENCAERGAVWIGTANNPQMIDPALLRPGRADLKLPIGNMEDFAVGDMIKYTLYKYGEKDSSTDFDYKKVVDTMKETYLMYTPAELELFVSQAKLHKISPQQRITADMVIAEMENYRQNDFPTLTEEMMARFREDQKFFETLEDPKN